MLQHVSITTKWYSTAMDKNCTVFSYCQLAKLFSSVIANFLEYKNDLFALSIRNGKKSSSSQFKIFLRFATKNPPRTFDVNVFNFLCRINLRHVSKAFNLKVFSPWHDTYNFKQKTYEPIYGIYPNL